MPLSFVINFKPWQKLENRFILGQSAYCHMNQNMYIFCPVHVPDTILLSISWELCSKYIWVCLLIRIDVMFYLGNEIVVQMLRRAPVCWPRNEHLICIELFRLPTSVLMFISETVINLSKIALSTVFYFSICFCKPLQYTVQSWRKPSQLCNDMLESAVLQNNLHSLPTPLAIHRV